MHNVLKLPEFNLQQSFFGEHLLKGNNMPVAIVESEKTAIIGNAYLPDFVWIATGSKNGLNAEKCIVLAGRNVILFPDFNGLEEWSNKAKELSHIACFNVSNFLERKASQAEKKEGLNLTDYLIRFDYKEFQNKPVTCLQSHLLNIHSDVLNPGIKTFSSISNKFDEADTATVMSI